MLNTRPVTPSTSTPPVKLTPGQELLLSTLLARLRMGEKWWSVAKGKAVRSAEEAGLIRTRSHNADHRFLYAELTDAGLALVASGTYVSPLEKRYSRVTAGLQDLVDDVESATVTDIEVVLLRLRALQSAAPPLDAPKPAG